MSRERFVGTRGKSSWRVFACFRRLGTLMRGWRNRQTASDCCLPTHFSELSLPTRTSCFKNSSPLSSFLLQSIPSTISYSSLHSQSSITSFKMSHIGNVIGGHKANLHNPNTSEKSKQHSLEVIEKELGAEASTSNGATAHNDDGKDPMRVYAPWHPSVLLFANVLQRCRSQGCSSQPQRL